MRLTITGASGFVGAHLARRLCSLGHEVKCLVRSTSDRQSLARLDVEFVQGDVLDRQSLDAAVRGSEVVFHLAGVRRAPSREHFFEVNAEGTRNVCDAMVAHGARRLVLAGSLAASGPADLEHPRREEDPLMPSEWYGESKAEAERIAFGYSNRMEVTCIRPVRIIGPWDRENLPFFKIVNRGWKLHVTGPRRAVSFIDVEDVVDQLLLMAGRREAVGQSFFSTAEAISLLELQDVVAEALGVTTRTLPIPPAVLLAIASGADVLSRATGKHLALNRKLARQLLAPGWVCSGEKTERVLGFRPSRDVRESIRRTAQWYRGAGWL